jgi:hypothetical protein
MVLGLPDPSVDPDVLVQGVVAAGALGGAGAVLGAKARQAADPRGLRTAARTMAHRYPSSYANDIVGAVRSRGVGETRTRGELALASAEGKKADAIPLHPLAVRVQQSVAQSNAPPPALAVPAPAAPAATKRKGAQAGDGGKGTGSLSEVLYAISHAAEALPAVPDASHGRPVTGARRQVRQAELASHRFAEAIAQTMKGAPDVDKLVAGLDPAGAAAIRSLLTGLSGFTPDELKAALESWVLDDLSHGNPGLLYANKRACEARLADMVQGDELGDTYEVDFAKVQMLVTTLLAAAVYLVSLWVLFSPANPAGLVSDYPLGLLQVQSLSTLAYVGNKLPSRTRAL